MQLLKEEIRQRIIEVGKKQFGEVGFEKTSMKNIAKDAGISIGNIYRYFLTKEHLFSEILSEVELEMRDFCESIASARDKHGDKLFELFIDKIIELSERKERELKIMFRCSNQKQLIELREKIISMFSLRAEEILQNMHESVGNEINKVKSGYIHNRILCDSISRSIFEGISFLIKECSLDRKRLRENLNAYVKIMVVDLEKRVQGVMGDAR